VDACGDAGEVGIGEGTFNFLIITYTNSIQSVADAYTSESNTDINGNRNSSSISHADSDTMANNNTIGNSYSVSNSVICYSYSACSDSDTWTRSRQRI
jgi:hypothetical protein